MPGNGIQPRYLAGREEYMESFTRSLQAYERGLPRNTVLSGMRGTGKTVLLRHFKVIAESKGWLTIEREFNERFSDENAFAEAVVADVISKVAEVSWAKKVKESGKKIVEIIKPEELGAYGITYKPFYKGKRHLLEDYLKEMLVKNWNPLKKSGYKGIVLLYDEFHTVRDRKDQKSFPLASLLGALSYAQRNDYNFYLCLGGLPIIKSHLKESKTYTERMFEFREIGNLTPEEARRAIIKTLEGSGIEFDKELVEKIVAETRGYPYFIQFYGYFTIEHMSKRKITLRDFASIRTKLIRELDTSFFQDRFNLASAREKEVLMAMAKVADSDIETKAIKRVSRMKHGILMELLKRLIDKGLVYRSERGRYGFTLPLFRDFLLRH